MLLHGCTLWSAGCFLFAEKTSKKEEEAEKNEQKEEGKKREKEKE